MTGPTLGALSVATVDEPIVLDVLGARVALRLHGLDEDGRDRVLADWSWCRTPHRASATSTTVHAVLAAPAPAPGAAAVPDGTSGAPDGPGSIVVRAADVDTLRDRLARALTLHAIDARAADLLLLHAAAVCDPVTGATVALVGRSGSGKTTAAQVLGRTFAYVTDETLGVQDDGTVVPYPKPLSVVRAGSPKAQVAPDVAGLVRSAGPAPWLAAVLLLDRDPSLPSALLEPVRVTEVVEPLFGQISYLSRRGRPLARLRRLVDATGGLRVLRYAEARDLAPVVGGVLAGVSGRPAATLGAVRAVTEASSSGLADPGASVRRAAVTDWVGDGDDVLVLHADRLHVLQAVGAAVWTALARPRSLDALVRHAVERFGTPEGADPSLLVARVVEELRASGLVETGPATPRAPRAPAAAP
ncbi:PqqD family protein [Curtobacterium sp. MCBD17_040]|uniref:PqqD family protein n=1 Tax=Curtobacterium sp. MCBD17_040 TaxID=2175674 RepID=UPI000DA70526|nr:PqqD family protein [Curtobacterium sp. MCBD17_040]WIB63318.1 hypothetical protein DEI94_14395 [Curtobacterium sp. MCBD17_040]